MRQSSLKSQLLLFVSLGVTASGLAQFSTSRAVGAATQGYVANIAGKVIEIHYGDKLRLPNGEEIVYKEGMALPTGITIEFNGQKAVVQRSAVYTSVAAFYTNFSVSGPLQQVDLGFKGGTRTVYGTVFSIDFGLKAKKPTAVGAWYFAGSKGEDLYQLSFRQYFQKSIGYQLAYINSTKTRVPAASYHLLINLDSALTDQNARKPYAVELGIGALSDFSDTINIASGTSTKRQSINFSAFTQGRLELSKKLSLVGSIWFFRDRNVDINRFGLGLESTF